MIDAMAPAVLEEKKKKSKSSEEKKVMQVYVVSHGVFPVLGNGCLS